MKRSQGSGLAIGITIGIAIGIALHNVGAGIAIGLAMGIALSSSAKRTCEDKDGKNDKGGEKDKEPV